MRFRIKKVPNVDAWVLIDNVREYYEGGFDFGDFDFAIEPDVLFDIAHTRAHEDYMHSQKYDEIIEQRKVEREAMIDIFCNGRDVATRPALTELDIAAHLSTP